MRVGVLSRWATVVAVTVLAAGIAPARGAQDADEPRTTIEVLRELQQQYHEAVAEEARLVAEYELSVVEQERVAGEIEDLNASIATTEATLDQKRAAADGTVAVLARSTLELADRKARLAGERMRLKRHSVAAYMYGEGIAAEAALGADRAEESVVVNEYSSTALGSQAEVVGEVAALEEEVSGLAERVEMLAAEAIEEREAVARIARVLDEKRSELRELNFVLGVEMNTQEGLISEVRDRQADYRRRLDALESDSDGVSAVLVEWQDEQDLGDVPTFLAPLGDIGYSSGFGPRVHPIFGNMKMHNGLDMGAPQGTPIRAAADGTVVMVQSRQGFGNVTVIDHGGRVGTVYAHQVGFAVEFGQEVAAGEVIGFVGSTGYSTGPHLHFEVRSQGAPIDPAPYVDFDMEVPCDVLFDSSHDVDVELLEARGDDCEPALDGDRPPAD